MFVQPSSLFTWIDFISCTNSFHPGKCFPVTQGQIRKCVKWIGAQKTKLYIYSWNNMRTRCLKKRGINYRTLSSFGLAYWATPWAQILSMSLTAAWRVYFEGSYRMGDIFKDMHTMGPVSASGTELSASPGILLIFARAPWIVSVSAQEGV